VDKATLVRSDLDIGGQVLIAIGRAKIPVTLCDWNYDPELSEWQLIIATPWYDKRGPREANTRILSALQAAGIYSQVPLLRLFVRSPQDPIVKSLEREIKAQTEGTIHVVASMPPDHSVQYSLIFAPFTGPGGAMPVKNVRGTERLREFLEESLYVARSDVEEALRELNRKGSASIFHVRLTRKEAKDLGLA